MKTVVVIEDDHQIAEILEDQINGLDGFVCSSKFVGPLSFLAQDIPSDFVLLDIIMPEMNGLDAIPLILEKYSNANIIINSSVDDLDSVFIALKLGAVGYIKKSSVGLDLNHVLTMIGSGGAFMTPEIAKKVFDFFSSSKSIINTLTSREQDVAQGILDGLSYKLVAARHSIAINTVRMHIKNIYQKLKINSKAELFNLLK